MRFKSINNKIILSFFCAFFFFCFPLYCGSWGFGFCGCRPYFKMPCCLEGRRPFVITEEHEDILDFDECDPGCDNCEDEDEYGGFSELTPDFFNPYAPSSGEYRVVKGDVLQISIVGDLDTLVESVVVAPDGMIYYLFLDGIMAEGRTLTEIRKEMEAKFSQYFNNPIVGIIPKTISNQTYVILGRVNKQGVYPLSYPVRVRDAIGQAGGLYVETVNEVTIRGSRGGGFGGFGFGRFGFGGRFGFSGSTTYQATEGERRLNSQYKAFLVRGDKKVSIDVERLIFQGNEKQNAYLRPGDYIYVSAAETRRIFVLGAVPYPTALNYSDHMTVMGALTSVGGWRYGIYGADMDRVLIIRGSLDCPRLIYIDLCMILHGKARDVYLCPGDILYVQNKQFRFGRELVRLAITSYIQAFVTGWAGDVAQNHIFN